MASSNKNLPRLPLSDGAVTLLATVAAFLFVWFSLRPVFFTMSCTEAAERGALWLAGTNGRTAPTPEERQRYGTLAAAGLYTQQDYEFFYRKCMREYGISR